jgi:hypothetical protein
VDNSIDDISHRTSDDQAYGKSIIFIFSRVISQKPNDDQRQNYKNNRLQSSAQKSESDTSVLHPHNIEKRKNIYRFSEVQTFDNEQLRELITQQSE